MVGHFCVITHHKIVVWKLAIKAGIPWRGFVHDLSKYSPVEFFSGVRYFEKGKRSPIAKEKEEKGYSEAWLHHKGRNKHHPEYWHDHLAKEETPIIPFCYVCEMICDQLSAGIVYQKKAWNKEYQLQYWERQKERFLLHPALKEMLQEVYTQVAQKGIQEVITKQNLKKLYEKYTNEYKRGKKDG